MSPDQTVARLDKVVGHVDAVRQIVGDGGSTLTGLELAELVELDSLLAAVVERLRTIVDAHRQAPPHA